MPDELISCLHAGVFFVESFTVSFFFLVFVLFGNSYAFFVPGY